MDCQKHYSAGLCCKLTCQEKKMFVLKVIKHCRQIFATYDLSCEGEEV